jgi:maltose-binding protein MalE
MKRILSLVLVIFSLTLLVACGGETGPATIEGKTSVDVRLGDPNFNLMAGITATDAVKGDILENVEVSGTVNVNVVGSYDVTFSVKGSDGELAVLVVTYNVKASTFKGTEDRKVTIGVAEFDPKASVYLVDGVEGQITSGAPIQPTFVIIIKHNGEEVEKVNTQELGEYEITYKATYKGVTTETVRIVTVVDEISFGGVGAVELEVGFAFVPKQGVTAIQPIIDEETGNRTTRTLTDYIVVFDSNLNNTIPGVYQVTYKIEDPDNLGQDPIVYLKENNEDVQVVRTITVYNKVEILGATNTNITKGDSFDPKAGVTARDSLGAIDASEISVTGVVDPNTLGAYTLTYKVKGTFDDEITVVRTVTVVPPIVGKTDIYFMSGNPSENDPFLTSYTGQNQKEKQDLQTATEEKYNVKVHYVTYPANASWGPARQSAMIQAHVNGKPLADVYYHISSDWIPNLANGGAIAPIDEFLVPGAHGEDVPTSIRNASKYKNKTYGFSTSGLNIESGFYYNADLVSSLGLQTPTDMYLAGNWTWSTFQAWALQAKAALKEKEYVLGGVISEYAENLVPLNGGEFINEARGRVDFGNQAALDTYAFIKELVDAELFEPSADRAYDAGSANWLSGKVVFHPGHFWFIASDDRWGKNINFELGFVPYPMSDDYAASGGKYRSPIYGPSFPVMAGGLTTQRKELVFKVWWDLQRIVPEEQGIEEFTNLLKQRFAQDSYVEAYLSVYDKAYRSVLYGIGIGRYEVGSFASAINTGIPDGSYRTKISEIEPRYKSELERYLDLA